VQVPNPRPGPHLNGYPQCGLIDLHARGHEGVRHAAEESLAPRASEAARGETGTRGGAVTPAEAIEAAELAEAEIRYRNQLAREVARAAYVRGLVRDAELEAGGGDLAAVLTSPPRARATSPAGAGRRDPTWVLSESAPLPSSPFRSM
jgi:hypothetical protein